MMLSLVQHKSKSGKITLLHQSSQNIGSPCFDILSIITYQINNTIYIKKYQFVIRQFFLMQSSQPLPLNKIFCLEKTELFLSETDPIQIINNHNNVLT